MIRVEKKYTVQDAFQRELTRRIYAPTSKVSIKCKKMDLHIIESFPTYQSIRNLLDTTPFIIIPLTVLEEKYVVTLSHRDTIRRLHNGLNLNLRNKARSLRTYTVRLVDSYVMVVKRERITNE